MPGLSWPRARGYRLSPAANCERQRVDFGLFILVTAVLFIRPSDIVPGLEAVPLYQIAIVPCILLSWHKLLPQFTTVGLQQRPVLVFAVGLLLLSIISSLLHGQFQTAFDFPSAWVKIPILYWLMLAQIDSPARLKLYVGWLVGIIVVPILLAVLHHHGYIYIEAFTAPSRMGIDPGLDEVTGIRRLRGSGNFTDPNDICEILNCAMIFTLYGLLDRGGGLTRLIWLVPLALFGHALALTQSRGGLLGIAVGIMVLFRSRYGGAKSLMLAGATLGLMFVLFAGRQTSFSTTEGTSQQRIQIWDAGFEMMKQSPLLGIGIDGFRQSSGVDHVAHNAFIQMYTELGFLGGTLLFGQYFYCLKNLKELGAKRATLPNPEMRRLQPFLMASMVSFAISEMTLTNGFGIVTYVMFGLATVFIRLANPSPSLPDLVLSRTLVRRIILFSGLFLIGLFVFTRLNLRYG
jgi:O-antigen ligase